MCGNQASQSTWVYIHHDFSLSVHLAIANMDAYPITYPTVPRGTALVRMLFRAHNTKRNGL
ncbi:hypothetical protein F5X98DRAFT_331905 [Xylaria grammica]|nr:hypothetical protein F5X98DRAFT_331905 [Xylaria grammica]